MKPARIHITGPSGAVSTTLPCPVPEPQETSPRETLVETILTRLEAMRDSLAGWPVS